MGQDEILKAMKHGKMYTIAELHQKTGYTKSQVSRALSRLEHWKQVKTTIFENQNWQSLKFRQKRFVKIKIKH